MSSLNIASRALTTNLAALQVIGNNIANVNTPGYSRQTIQLTTTAGQFLGNGYFGKGVEIAGVTRAYDAQLTREAQTTKSVAASDLVRFQRLQQLEALFPLGENSLGVSLNSALNAWSAVASSPGDTTARTVVISRAEELTSRLREMYGNLEEQRMSATLQVEETVNTINNLAVQIADLNQRIIESRGSGRVPNDLMDRRDQLITELNRYVQTSTVEASNGGLSVFVAGSQPLVVGAQSSALRIEKNALEPLRLDVSIVQAGQPFKLNLDFVGGGDLKGLLNFVNVDVPDTINSIGRLTLSLALQINAQHRQGLDLNGNPGKDFFSLSPLPPGVPYPGNVGGATVGISVSNPTALKASDYELRFEDLGGGVTGVRAYRLSDSPPTAIPPVGETAIALDGNPVTLAFTDPLDSSRNLDEGLTLTFTGTPDLTDRFLLRPLSTAARDIAVALSAPESLAAASPILIASSESNAGSLSVQGLSLTAGTPMLAPPFDLVYNDLTGEFDIANLPLGMTVVTPPGAYSPGQPMSFEIDVGGGETLTYSLTLRGVPADGDTFSLSLGTGNQMRQNFGNAQAILDLRDVPSLGGVPLGDGYISVFSAVAGKVQGARFAAEFSETAATSAEAARAGRVGVNLDEEAARLLQYQQAYQASAKFLQVAQGTFDTLIQSFGR